MKFDPAFRLHLLSDPSTRYGSAIDVIVHNGKRMAATTDGRALALVPVEFDEVSDKALAMPKQQIPPEAWALAVKNATKTLPGSIGHDVDPATGQTRAVVWQRAKGDAPPSVAFPLTDVKTETQFLEVLPKASAPVAFRVTLNPQILLDLAKALGGIDGGDDLQAVTLHVLEASLSKGHDGVPYADDLPMRVTVERRPDVVGAIMPISE